MTNDEICRNIDSTDAWIRERSGIITRRFAAPDETVVDMATSAASKALAASGIAPDDVDLVLLATCTHPYQTPGGSSEVQDRLGAIKAGAMDINAACAGFAYALAVANDAVRGGSARYVVVIGSEKMTDFIDPHDRGMAFLFGDGAGAAVVSASPTPGIGPVVWGSDGSHVQTITQKPNYTQIQHALATGDIVAARGAPDGGPDRVPVGRHQHGAGRAARTRCRRRQRRRARRVRSAPGEPADRRVAGEVAEAADHRRDRPRHGNAGQHVVRFDSVGPVRAARAWRGPEWPARPVHWIRRRPHLRCAGRRGSLTPRLAYRSTTTTTNRRSTPMALSQQEILAGLAEIVNEVAGIPASDVQMDKSFTDDLDVDSLSMVEVVVAAEEKFGVRIPDDDVKNLKTVGDAVTYIEKAGVTA